MTKSITRRTALRAAALAVAAPALVGRGRAAHAQARARVLRFVPEFDVRVLDPIVNTGLSTLQHGYMVYDTLFAMDRSFTPKPQMVEQYEVATDRKSYSFRLRAGLKFHDGQPVRAADCIASIRRWGARDVMGRRMLQAVDDFDALDERSFRMRLKEPYGLVLDTLAKVSASPCLIMRESDARTDPNTALTVSVGSGPFVHQPAESQPGAKIVYTRFADYVARSEPSDGYAGAKLARVERVEWSIIPDASTQVNALIAGEVDIVNTPPLDVLAALRAAPGVSVRNIDPQGWFAYIRPNHLHPPFNDVRARQALMLLVNQEDYLRAAAGDPANWKQCYAFMICGSPMGSEAGADPYRRVNSDRARALMQEAGYRGDPIVVLHPSDNPILGAITDVTIRNLRAIGCNVDVQSSDLATAFARRARREAPAQGGWNIFHTRSLGVELNNPLTSFPLASPCGRDASGVPQGWFGWACDERIETLRSDWMQAPDAAARRAVAEQIQLRAIEFLPFIPVGQIFTPIAMRANVQGLIEMPVPVLWNAALA